LAARANRKRQARFTARLAVVWLQVVTAQAINYGRMGPRPGSSGFVSKQRQNIGKSLYWPVQRRVRGRIGDYNGTCVPAFSAGFRCSGRFQGLDWLAVAENDRLGVHEHLRRRDFGMRRRSVIDGNMANDDYCSSECKFEEVMTQPAWTASLRQGKICDKTQLDFCSARRAGLQQFDACLGCQRL